MAQHHIHAHAGPGSARALSENPIIRTSRLKCNAQGWWQIAYNVRDDNGGWRSKTFATKTKDFTQAQIELDRWLNQAKELITGSEPARVTLNDVIDDYMNAKDVTHVQSVFYILRNVRAHLGGLTPSELNAQVMQNYRLIRRNNRTGHALKDGTVRRELGALITALNYAVKHRRIERNDVPAIDLPNPSPPRVSFMDKTQEQQFWQAAQAEGGELGLFVALGLETAARKGAILGLTWERINFTTRLIDLREPGARITRKRRAVVPISNRLLPVLKACARPSGRLFSSRLRRKYDTFIARIGMPWVTPHVMRHTWASHAAQDGVALFHIAKMLGDTVGTVERTYAHLTPAHLHDVVNRARAA